MACRNAYIRNTINVVPDIVQTAITESVVAPSVNRLLFGVDSANSANVLLQNNIDQFEWVIRNKIYPNFWGRYISGDNCLTKEEINFLHSKGCKIGAIYATFDEKLTEDQAKDIVTKIDITALNLGIPKDTAIFLEIGEDEKVTVEFMKGFAEILMKEGYTPGFKANTDAKYNFDRVFSTGMQNDKEVFDKCLIWATAPLLADYDEMTTSHLIHPDNWKPFAPSAITRKEIAIWQYGKDCHPIYDDNDNLTSFNLNLIRKPEVIINKMF